MTVLAALGLRTRPPPGRIDSADYVLRPFSSAEGKELDLQVDRAADAV